ncbi:MAG: hypothetical protein HOW73_14415 [Polyangiaceae bacterium]|nr:hypothetical protein [Polyangiaceae bacterium]
MAQAIRMAEFASRPELGALVVQPAHQAYRILHLGYFVLPLIAGADKYFNRLATWSDFLAPSLMRPIPHQETKVMYAAGAIEVLLALIVAFKPSVGAYLLALWLLAVIANLWLGQHYDMALRDFGLFLGALALGRLAQAYSRERVYVED